MCVGRGEGGGGGGGGGPHELKVGCVRKLLVLWNCEPKMDPSMISSGGMFTIESWCAFVEGAYKKHTHKQLVTIVHTCSSLHSGETNKTRLVHR